MLAGESQLIDIFWLHVTFFKRWWGKNQDFMIIRWSMLMHRGVWRVHGGVCGRVHRGFAEGCMEVHRGVRRCAEGCMEVHRGTPSNH